MFPTSHLRLLKRLTTLQDLAWACVSPISYSVHSTIILSIGYKSPNPARSGILNSGYLLPAAVHVDLENF